MVASTERAVGLAARKNGAERTLIGDGAAQVIPGAVVFLVIVGTLLAGSAVFAKWAPTAGWSPIALLQWSLLGTAMVQFAVVAFWKAGSARERPEEQLAMSGAAKFRQLALYCALSGLLFAVPNALAYASARHVGVGFIALCFAFPLVLTYALSVVLGRERLSGRRLTGVGLGVAGGVLLAWQGLGQSPGNTAWYLAALVMPVLISIGNIYRSAYWPDAASPQFLSAGMMAFGFITLSVLNAVLGTELAPATYGWQAMALLAAQVGLFSTLYALYFQLQKLAGPVYLSQIGSVAAVVGLALAYMVFGEVPSPTKLFAATAIAAGIYFVSRKN
ncbi:DMT family transporter [Labrenzia polysiphoniae]|uniref:DMT family transporter n=1 Tax=Roseibium polysiphoniae TaxID=2571221 RepID=A0ABR9C516_9HYPH|nr:DMT family transporter [Roseibium polysiphoniae]